MTGFSSQSKKCLHQFSHMMVELPTSLFNPWKIIILVGKNRNQHRKRGGNGTKRGWWTKAKRKKGEGMEKRKGGREGGKEKKINLVMRRKGKGEERAWLKQRGKDRKSKSRSGKFWTNIFITLNQTFHALKPLISWCPQRALQTPELQFPGWAPTKVAKTDPDFIPWIYVASS